jgi:heme/copper-type cytochrome/quinol oxidase subunit 3
VWPPFGYKRILVDPFRIPLLKTIILLSSGVTVTWCHHSVLGGKYQDAVLRLRVTCLLGRLFLCMQIMEYRLRYFSINSMVYGTVFFLLTGFHGMHVIVGTIFLMVCLFRLIIYDLKAFRHVGFERAAWYWHFVDVVWLFLFFFVY